LSTLYFRITARASAGAHLRAPVLERLLARADAPLPVDDWRADALRPMVGEPGKAPAVAVAALQASRIVARGAWVAVATPVHLVAGLRSVALPPDGIVALEPADAEALARDFNRVFSDAGVRLEVARENVLLCLFDEPLQVALSTPDDVLGEDIGAHLPGGVDGARVRRLMSEVEMWLFEHPVNARRRTESLAVASGLWLWGGGATDTPHVTLDGWAAGDAALCAFLTPAAHYPAGGQSGIVAVAAEPGGDAWIEAERRWLEPALDDLRAGRLEAVELSMGRRRVRAGVSGQRRFWRRARPWWEILRDGD
jgi:hypothetical protein